MGESTRGLTGIPLSLPSLQYWTVAGPALWQTQTVAGTQRPDPTMVDAAFMFAYEVIQKRRVMEGLAQVHGIRLVRPELPRAESTTLSRVHTMMVEQFEEFYEKTVGDQQGVQFARYSAAVARTLGLGNAYHLQFETDNRAELADLLGKTPVDFDEGMAKLEDDIVADFNKDIEWRIAFLYRYEARREHLYKPMQLATGVTHAAPLDPI